MRHVAACLLVFSTLTVLGPDRAESCQLVPTGPAPQVTCQLHAATECWAPGEPIHVFYTLTDQATEEPFPRPTRTTRPWGSQSRP